MKEKLSPFQVSILIYMIQSGVVLFSLPRLAGEAFGTNGWIGIIFAYIIVNLNLVLIWLVFKVGGNRSIFELMGILPKWLTFPFTILIIAVWLPLGTMVCVKFIFMLKTLFYPEVSKVMLFMIFLSLSYLLLQKGIYGIAKAAVVLFFFTIWTTLLLMFHIPEFSFIRMTPFIFQGDKNLLIGGIDVYTSLVGYELSLLFLHRTEKKKLKALIIGNSITTVVYLGVCFISFGFFSMEQMLKTMYPVVHLLEYVTFPVLERTENLIFSLFGLKTLITIVMYYWGTIEFLSFQFRKIPRKLILYTTLISAFILSFLPTITREVDQMLTYLAYAAITIAYLLPLKLLLLAYFGFKKKEENVNE